MPIYTSKEYSKLTTTKTQIKKAQEIVTVNQNVTLDDFVHVFLHPDGESINGVFTTENGSEQIIDGIIKTRNISFKDELLKRGFNYFGKKLESV